jgi:hypothetical protein
VLIVEGLYNIGEVVNLCLKGKSMNRDRDQFLTEAMGEVWHVVKEGFIEGFGDTFKCSCGLENYSARMCRKKNKTFSTPDGFFKLWNWFKNHPDYVKMVMDSKLWSGYCSYRCYGKMNIPDGFINPDKFADALYNYLKEYQ